LYFVYNKSNNSFLINEDIPEKKTIKNNSIPLSFKLKNKSYSSMEIKKNIKNQIGLDPSEVFPLNWGRVYNSYDGEVKEMFYLVFLDLNQLNYFGVYHKWVDLNLFIKKLNWRDNKKLLKEVLIKAVKKEAYFDKKEREENL
jgi:hypothetical protein